MEKNNFISQLFQWISTITAISVPISQFILKDQFKLFFSIDEKFFDISSIISFIFSIVIILALYSNRYLISFKFYLNKTKKEKYYRYLNNFKNQDFNKENNVVIEPFSITLEKIAILSIIFSCLWFYLFISSSIIHIISLSYVLLIISIVFSASIFAIKLYLENYYKISRKNSNQIIITKIKEYLAGDIKIKSYFDDNKSIVLPIRYLTIEWKNDIYKIAVNPNDPESYFIIDKINE